ncbi:T9SS type A sorting domain-containing protein, partial [bacterium]|nr:T9SS type A sorting domain-containing protein [bacterium]
FLSDTDLEIEACAVDSEMNVLICGASSMGEDSTWIPCIRVVKTDSFGHLIWERCFVGWSANFEPTMRIVELPDGEMMVAFVDYWPALTTPTLLRLSANGDSLSSYQFPLPLDWFSQRGQFALDQEGVLHFMAFEYEMGAQNPEDRLHWIQFATNSEIIAEIFSYTDASGLIYAAPMQDGMLAAGIVWETGVSNTDLLVARAAPSGDWQYVAQIEMPSHQSLRGIFPASDSAYALFGTYSGDESLSDPAIYFIGDDGPGTYIYSVTPHLDFGVVPLDETGSITVQLHLTGDTSAIITDFTIAENYATSLHLPDTIYSDVPFEFLIGFRPTERRIYVDTLRIFSAATNSELIIPMRGQAPFPVLTLDSELLDFHWVHLGDSALEQFNLYNTGTDTLFVQEFNEHPPFYLDSVGPFIILAGDSFDLQFTFHPSEMGLYEHWLRFESNDPEELDSVRLLGRCVSPNDAEDVPEIPRDFKLHSAYPNPFNSTTTLRFDLPRAFHVKLTLYNLAGQEVAVLLDSPMYAGAHTVSLNSEALASGLYFAHLVAGENVATQKLVLLK